MNNDLEQSLLSAAESVADDGVIAYPTDTVYGLGCNPLSEKAVTRLLKIKNRDPEKGLILLAAEPQQFSAFIDNKWLDWLTQQKPQQPTTYIVPCVETVPNWLTGNRNTLAIRITAEEISRRLCLKTGAIVSTSANLQGQPPIMDSEGITTQLKHQPDYVIPGKINASNQSSLIVDAISGNILRS